MKKVAFPNPHADSGLPPQRVKDYRRYYGWRDALIEAVSKSGSVPAQDCRVGHLRPAHPPGFLIAAIVGDDPVPVIGRRN
jgi:hypothetical protein